LILISLLTNGVCCWFDFALQHAEAHQLNVPAILRQRASIVDSALVDGAVAH